MATNDLLVWVDCEMTGLDLINDELIEVAALVTDADLNVLGDGVDLVIKPSSRALEQMGTSYAACTKPPVCSACWIPIVPGRGRTTRPRLRARIRSRSGQGPARGQHHRHRSSIPGPTCRLRAHVHYRSVDVSSIKELVRRWYPRVYYQAPAKAGNHRALADVQESIEELRYYREAVFVPPPGPDSATSKEMADHHQGALTGTVPSEN